MEGFEKGTSQNLPVVDAGMVFEFYRNHQDFHSAEFGYVQVRRHSKKCIVKAKVSPEHKVHSKGYNVFVEIDEEGEMVLHCQCLDCAASEGS
ncbi:hypothetical protein JTB14_031710 [Gonioctena quinquepunctata]|nr:hypothetical protein JTB14_031710 [Gonioctena quinquepunctata]